MKLAVDATSAAVQQAGVGRYTRELLIALSQLRGDHSLLLASSATEAQNETLLRTLPPGVLREVRRIPLNPRLATAAWHRLRIPLPVESLVGDFDVFHGPDFVVPTSRRPRVVTIHDLSYLLVPQFADPALVRYLTNAVPRSLDAADVVITVSAAVANDVADAYPSIQHKLAAIPNGVRVPNCSRPRIAGDRPEVLIVGTIEPRKNHLTLLSAIEIVRNTCPDAILTIAGRIGWRSEEIVAAIRRAERTGTARFVESPSDDDLEDLYARATLATCPSHYEGFGLPVLEAMARGVPVVASDINSLREVGGDAALYANPGDAESIASAIVQLIDDAALRDALADAGRARARGFSWTETAHRTMRAYHRAAGSRR